MFLTGLNKGTHRTLSLVAKKNGWGTEYCVLSNHYSKPFDQYSLFDCSLAHPKVLDKCNLLVLVSKFRSVYLLRYEHAKLFAEGSLPMAISCGSIFQLSSRYR